MSSAQPELPIAFSSPWRIERPHAEERAPESLGADVTVVGAGLTGLATARELLHRRPELVVAVLEADRVGSGASGSSGGIVLDGTASGDLPGFEGCLAAIERVVRQERIVCDLDLGGCWIVGRSRPASDSPIAWQDSGELHVTEREPGGSVDVGALLTGLWSAVERRGGRVYERSAAHALPPSKVVVLAADRAGVALLGDASLVALLRERWTFGLTLDAVDFTAAGWYERRPFYTEDLPYLWGRALRGDRAVIGAGLSAVGDVEEARVRLNALEARIRALHPRFAQVRVIHRSAGPISFSEDWQPLLGHVAIGEQRVHYAAGYAGHGVALSFRVAERIADAVLADLL